MQDKLIPLCKLYENPSKTTGKRYFVGNLSFTSKLLIFQNEDAKDGEGLEGLAQSFFPKAAEIIVTPWTLAAKQDLAYPQTQGERPADLEKGARYFAALDALTADDVEVHRLVVNVLNLVKPLSALNEEPLRSRVVAQQQKQGST